MLVPELLRPVFLHWLPGNPELHIVSEWANQSLDVSVMRFGKYKGLPLAKVFELDQKYLNWIRGNREMKASNQELVNAVEKLFREST